MDYRSSEFLTSGDVSLEFDELDYQQKLKIKALEGLDSLAASLNAISNIKAIEFQINHLNEMSSGFTEQLDAKDLEIEALTEQLNNIQSSQQAALEAIQDQAMATASLQEAEIAALKAANQSLTENFNKFKSVLTSIDHLTDEVID